MSNDAFAELVIQYFGRYSSVPQDIVTKYELAGNQRGALNNGYSNAPAARQRRMVTWIQGELAKPVQAPQHVRDPFTSKHGGFVRNPGLVVA